MSGIVNIENLYGFLLKLLSSDESKGKLRTQEVKRRESHEHERLSECVDPEVFNFLLHLAQLSIMEQDFIHSIYSFSGKGLKASKVESEISHP